MSITATIFNISRGSMHDGPGIRTVVYFKGCNLSCVWCHNPEGLSKDREISFTAAKCIACGKCREICPTRHTENGFLRATCTVCGNCVEACTAKALEIVGKPYTVEQLFSEVQRDEPYFHRSGGVTLSGGECLLQVEFAAAFLRRCKEVGWHTLIESAFCVSAAAIEKVLPYTDEFFVDCKLFDSEKHRLYTGAGNESILENIRRFAPKSALTVRVPLIPKINDDRENLQKTVAFAKSAGANGVEILRFNPLGVSKYESLGRTGVSFGKEPQRTEELEWFVRDLNAFLGEESFVYCVI